MPVGKSRFCPHCAAPLAPAISDGEERNFWACKSCGRPHHEHPMIVVTTFVACARRLLWVRRAIEPRRGHWAIPGGFLEHGEPLREGAARELREEAGVTVDPAALAPYMLGTLTFINQIYVGFRAQVPDQHCAPGRESLECAFFTRKECPWNEVAYPEVNDAVEQAYTDLETGDFRQWHVEMTETTYDLEPVRTGPLRPDFSAPAPGPSPRRGGPRHRRR